jgi:hypothetical protein
MLRAISAISILCLLLPCTICAQGIEGDARVTGALLNSDTSQEKGNPAAEGTAEIISASNSIGTNHDEPIAWDSSSMDCSDLSHYKWTFDPSQDLPINRALLSGAKSLLKADCTYSEGSPDYLPGSYVEKRNNATNYVIHAYEPTHVYWRLDGDHLLKWESRPACSPCGWSAIVTTSDIVTDHDQADVTQCFTDCSGLITALLCYANTQHPTVFEGWMKGGSVPVAGCRDPYGGCREPNAVNYYRLFDLNITYDQGRKEFQKITLDNLTPGDIIAYADTGKNATNTGHMMLVVAVADFGSEPLSRLVVVIDEIGRPHRCDTRWIKRYQGIGMGVIKLTFERKLELFWAADSVRPQNGAVALGRAM